MIVLATKSQARRRLLKKCKRNAIITVSNIDEKRFVGESIVEYLLRVSFLKALSVKRKNQIVIGADTVIYFDGRVIGKPKDREEAYQILSMLSGKIHQVYTGVSVISDKWCERFVEVASVKVDKLTEDEINSYLDTNEYMGRAAGYAIQGRARHFMHLIEGDITTVIGLPMKRLCKII
ncbi:Maf family protein [Hippea alviniae]|uniref:Maf family protein n=1 Tax=Hippea alviniae TaxID=1279027 RepID=UPI0003B32336|nr:Maf family protein [Hippea alviniae]